MSLAGKLRETMEANAALTEQVNTVGEELAGIKATHAAQVGELESQVQAAQAELTSRNEQLDAVKQEAESVKAEKAKLAQELQEAMASIKSAEEKLSNPAFEHASAGAAKAPAPNSDADESKSPEQFQAEYQAESDPAKRASLWRKFFNRG